MGERIVRWLVVDTTSLNIQPFECSRETNLCVWPIRRLSDGRRVSRRELRTSQSGLYFNTFEEARRFLIDRCLERIDHHENGLEHQRERLSKLKLLTEPTPDPKP